MNVRHKFGTACIGLGVVLLCAALLLFLFNQKEAYEAEMSADSVLPLLKQQIPEEPQQINPVELGIPVEFRDPALFVMTEKEIDWYVSTGEPMDKAGAYGVQGPAAVFVKEIQGNYFNVIGMPVPLLYQMLLDAGVMTEDRS